MDRASPLDELFSTPLPDAGVAELEYTTPRLSGRAERDSEIHYESVAREHAEIKSMYGARAISISEYSCRCAACTSHDLGRLITKASVAIRGVLVHIALYREDPEVSYAGVFVWDAPHIKSIDSMVRLYAGWPVAREKLVWRVGDLAADALALLRAYPDAPHVEVLAVLHRAVHSFDYRGAPNPTPLRQYEIHTRAAVNYFVASEARAAFADRAARAQAAWDSIAIAKRGRDAAFLLPYDEGAQ